MTDEPDGEPAVIEAEVKHAATYRDAGIDYDVLDAGKRLSQLVALSTSHLANDRGASASDESRGEPAFLLQVDGIQLALVLECLGTKSRIARQYYETTGIDRFEWVGVDTVAAIVNDLCCVGALPVVVNAYFATGSAGWYAVQGRHESLVRGWRRGCEQARAIWGGGESPTLPGIIAADEIDLAGCGIGRVPKGCDPFSAGRLQPGDEIVLVGSTGLHTNGATLARLAADRAGGLDARLDDGTVVGDALLQPSAIYVDLVERVMAQGLGVVYASHITGHGLRKLMRADRQLTYRISSLPDVPPALQFVCSVLDLSDREAYGTFNMGAGMALYCRPGGGAAVVAAAQACSQTAIVAGRVEDGPRQVILEPVNESFSGEELNLR